MHGSFSSGSRNFASLVALLISDPCCTRRLHKQFIPRSLELYLEELGAAVLIGDKV